MLSCKDVTEHTSNYLDKKMSVYQRMQFRLHIMMCKGCQRFVDQFKITVASIKGIEPEPVRKDDVDRQVEALMKHTKK